MTGLIYAHNNTQQDLTEKKQNKNKVNILRQDKFNIMFVCILLCIAIILYLFNINISIYGGALVLFVSLLTLLKVKKNNSLFLLFFIVLYFNYSIVVGNYFFPSMRIGIHNQGMADIEYVYQTGLLAILIFMCAVFFCIKRPFKNVVIKRQDNPTLFLIFAVITLCVFLFINEERLGGSYLLKVISEYNLIFVALLCLFSGESKTKKYFVILLVTCIAIKEFLTGGRVTSIQCVLIVYLFYFAETLNYKYIIPICLLGICGLNYIGQVRLITTIGFGETILNLLKSGFVLDTANFAYEASITHLLLMKDVTIGFRLESFARFVASIFLGNTLIDTNIAQLTPYASQFYYNLGGGIVPSYWLFWLSWPGVIIVGAVIALICNWANTIDKYSCKSLIFVVFISSVFRWYLYNTLQIWRMSLFFMFIAYIGVEILKKMFYNEKDIRGKIKNEI